MQDMDLLLLISPVSLASQQAIAVIYCKLQDAGSMPTSEEVGRQKKSKTRVVHLTFEIR